MPALDAPAAGRSRDVRRRLPSAHSRGRGLGLTAALAVLLALAVQVLHLSAARTLTSREWSAAQEWLPTVMSWRVSLTADPWSWLLAASTLLTLGLGVLVIGVVVRAAGRRRWWARAGLLWMAVVGAAVLTVGATELGQLVRWIEIAGGRGGSYVRTFTAPALGEALRWGLLWGLPAAAAGSVVAATRGRRRAAGSRDEGGRTEGARAVAAVVLATVVSAVALAVVARATSIAAETAVAARPAPEPVVTDTPAAVAPSTGSTPADRCDPADLSLDFAFTDAASGRRWAVATVVNDGPRTCTIAGTPDLAFRSEDGNAVRPRLQAWAGPTGDVVERAVELAPGSVAAADATWRGAGAGATTVVEVLVAPWAGVERIAVPVDLDLETGALLEVTPWHPEAEASGA